jgi:hypothetical protein
VELCDDAISLRLFRQWRGRSRRAQQPIKVPRIGVLWHAGNEQEEAIYLGAMRQGFRDIGYIEGKSLLLENRFPNERPDRMLSIRLIRRGHLAVSGSNKIFRH